MTCGLRCTRRLVGRVHTGYDVGLRVLPFYYRTPLLRLPLGDMATFSACARSLAPGKEKFIAQYRCFNNFWLSALPAHRAGCVS